MDFDEVLARVTVSVLRGQLTHLEAWTIFRKEDVKTQGSHMMVEACTVFQKEGVTDQ